MNKNHFFENLIYLTTYSLIPKHTNMKILKNILIAIAVILGIAAVGIYFLPDRYNVSSSIEITKPSEVVYAQVSDFNKWSTWSPWQELDPKASIRVEGASSSEGHKMTWNGEKSGEGNMTIVLTEPGKRVSSELNFIKPFKATAKDYWTLEQTGNTTKVTWGTEGGLSYPFGRLFGLSVDDMLGKSQKHGLENLKKVCEAISDASLDSTAVVIVK